MIQTRIANLKKILIKKNLDCALVSSVANIIYLTDFAAFSDKEREAFLLVTPKSQYIFTDARYTHAVKKQVEDFVLCEISGSKRLSDHLKEIIKDENIVNAGIENNNITVAEHVKISTLFKEVKHFDLNELRIKKDEMELSAIKKACQIGDMAFDFILGKIAPAISEKELAFELEFFIRKNGGELSFPTIAAFEENAAVPHHHTGQRKLKKNEAVLLDFGVKYENYCSDMTRTVFMGKADTGRKKIYETVLEAQIKAAETISKGLNDENKFRASEADKMARQIITGKGYPTIPHSLGHGIGLEVHERPWLSKGSDDFLGEGMVFSIEPGIYLPEEIGEKTKTQKKRGFGVRIEDLFAIEKNKLVALTAAPKGIIEL